MKIQYNYHFKPIFKLQMIIMLKMYKNVDSEKVWTWQIIFLNRKELGKYWAVLESPYLNKDITKA